MLHENRTVQAVAERRHIRIPQARGLGNQRTVYREAVHGAYSVIIIQGISLAADREQPVMTCFMKAG